MAVDRIDNAPLWDFLYYGYIPHLPRDWKAQPWAQVQVETEVQRLSDKELRRSAIQSFESGIRERGSSQNVVMLSGGNDSRAILAALLRHYTTDEIITVTYGTPGTTDFEVPKILAKEAGVEHVQIDLTATQFTLERLESVALELRENPIWLFGAFANRLVASTFGGDVTYWSGYLGGPVTGSHAPSRSDDLPWDEAISNHATRGPLGGFQEGFPQDYEPVQAFPSLPLECDTPLTRAELIDLALRQYPFLYPEHHVSGMDYRFPFLYPAYLRVMFNAGHDRRRRQKLYLSSLFEAYPRLFQLPHKDHLGLKPQAGKVARRARRGMNYGRRALNWIDPHNPRWVPRTINHIDWDQGFRYRGDLKGLALQLLADLGSRGLLEGADPVRLLKDHISGRTQGGMMISKLTALELYLRIDAISGEK